MSVGRNYSKSLDTKLFFQLWFLTRSLSRTIRSVTGLTRKVAILRVFLVRTRTNTFEVKHWLVKTGFSSISRLTISKHSNSLLLPKLLQSVGQPDKARTARARRRRTKPTRNLTSSDSFISFIILYCSYNNISFNSGNKDP